MKRREFIQELKDQARDLVEDADNMDYVRGVCELIAYMDSRPETDSVDRAVQIGEELNVYRPERMY